MNKFQELWRLRKGFFIFIFFFNMIYMGVIKRLQKNEIEIDFLVAYIVIPLLVAVLFLFVEKKIKTYQSTVKSRGKPKP